MPLQRRLLVRLKRFVDCNVPPMRKLFVLPVLAFLLFSCAPQAAYFQVDIRDMQSEDLNLENKQIAVFSLVPANKLDSARVANAALGVAEKLRQDRGYQNPLPVFSIPVMEFAGFNSPMGLDKGYLKDLMLTTGADVQVFIENLRYDSYKMESSMNFVSDYSTNIVELPYSVDMHIYDVLEDSLLFKTAVKDTVYMQLLSDTKTREYSGFVAHKLTEVSGVVGESLGAMLTRQWSRQERMLVNYPDNPEWEKPLALAMDFKWKEAIDLWMPMAGSDNFRIASYAAYNIAVGCEMMLQFDLAREWADFSVRKYKFGENEKLKEYLRKSPLY